ncbi:MAG: hypothetical protein QM758_03830 [Armatimonas sp.]
MTKKLLLTVFCLAMLIGSAMAQSFPAPKGFVLIKNPQLKDLMFTISPPAPSEKPVAAFVRSTDMGLLDGSKIENRPAAYATLKVTSVPLTLAKFQKAQGLTVASMKTALNPPGAEKSVAEDITKLQKKYNVKLSLKTGKNIFLGTEKVSDRSFLFDFLSVNNKVKTQYHNYTVDYYFCVAAVYYKSRMYTLTLTVPVKGSADMPPAKNSLKSWIKQFYAKNGIS